MTVSVRQLLGKVRTLVRDPLYRGTLLLLINSGLLSVLGFAFWTLAARKYPASTVGAFSGLSSGIGLVSAIASLGLQNLVTRRIASSESPRSLLTLVVVAITALGGTLCAFVVLTLGRFLPPALHLQAHGRSAALFTALVILTSLSGVFNAGLVALRAPWAVLWTNLVGAVSRIVSLIALASLRSSGLVLSFALGLFLATVLSVPPLAAKTDKRNGMKEAAAVIRRHLSTTVNNYIATIFGIAPGTIVPLIVISRLGTTRTAAFSLAFLVSGFLNIIPSTAAQVLFAEVSRRGVTMTSQLRKAIRAIYVILVPLLLVIVLTAPFIMRIFGSSYAVQGTSTLRVLSLATLLSAGNYLVDSMLIARDRGAAYLFMNAANTAFVLGCVSALLDRGLVGGAIGWLVSQVASLLLGLVIIAMGRTGRHRQMQSGRMSTGTARRTGERGGMADATSVNSPAVLSERLGLRDIDDFSDAPNLVSTMPIYGLVAERHHVRPTIPGEVVFLGIFDPRLGIDADGAQDRSSARLLVSVSGYSGWLSALLIPSTQMPDLLAGCWEVLRQLGGLPHYLVWDSNWLTAECSEILRSAGAGVLLANDDELEVINATYRYILREFIVRKPTPSLKEFNRKLTEWLQVDNVIPVERSERERVLLSMERVLLSMADRQAMRRLPPSPYVHSKGRLG